MKNTKRLSALALVLTLVLTACGGTGGTGGTGGQTAKTPDDVIKASQEKMATIKSMDSTMLMEMELGSEDQTLTMNTNMDMTMFTDPTRMKIDMTVDMGEMGTQAMSMYAQIEGDSYTTYSQNGATWAKQSMSADMMDQYDSRKSMELYLTSGSNFKADGTEKLDGGDADKYSGVISSDSMAKVLENTGAMSSMGTILGDDASALADIYKDLGDLPITVWVDQATGYPVRYNMDMTSIMNKVMEKAMAASGDDAAASEGIKVSKMILTMDCSNFDKATEFTIPEEALAAAG